MQGEGSTSKPDLLLKAASALEHAPVDAADVLKQWSELTEAEEAKYADAVEFKDRLTKGVISFTSSRLSKMRSDISAGHPTFVFALAAEDADGVEAVATVASRSTSDEYGETTTLEILDLVARPTQDWQRGGRTALVRMIIEFAKGVGVSVTAAPAGPDAEYYEDLGFENCGCFGDTLTYIGSGSAFSDDMQPYRMVTLSR